MKRGQFLVVLCFSIYSGLFTIAGAISVNGEVHGVYAMEIDEKARVTDEAPLQHGGTLPPSFPSKPELYDPSSELSLAYLAEAVYTFATPVAGWELQAQTKDSTYWLPGHSHAALYSKEVGEDGNATTKCAIVFSVHSKDLENWTTHPGTDHTLSVEECKLVDVHKGMMEELLMLLLGSAWTHQFEPYVHDNCHQMFTGGHGFGGALASLYAACANAAHGLSTLPHLYKNGVVVKQGQTRKFMNVTGLYTFGAPGVSKIQLTNYMEEDGAFAGGRFYNEDKIFFDPMPFSSTALHFHHPKVAAVRLESQQTGWIHRKEYEATSLDAQREPDYFRTPSSRDSAMQTYLGRLHRAPVTSGLTAPGLGMRFLVPEATEPPPVQHANLTRRENGRYHAQLDGDKPWIPDDNNTDGDDEGTGWDTLRKGWATAFR